MKKILILGAGMVAGPIIKYFLNKGFLISIASNDVKRAKKLANSNSRATIIDWNAENIDELDKLIPTHDIVVSLLPFAFHTKVAKKCIQHNTNMVTTSYVKDEMKDLDKKAKDAGILILNECGLDPGIDHMSAKRIIDTIHGFGGKVNAFYSICGALPAPELCDQNPFGYKFTWSPRGVLLSSDSDAQYMKDKKKVSISSAKLMQNTTKLKYPKIGNLEVYPNRNSIPYIKLYNIQETETMFRGTFRYPGWCEAIHQIKKLDLLNQSMEDFSGLTYAGLVARKIEKANDDELKKEVAKKLRINLHSHPMVALEFLGLFEDKVLPRTKDSCFNIVEKLMVEKMMIQSEERDMSLLQHIFKASYPDGREEVIKSNLIDFGSLETGTSIARTVALTAACATKMILDGEISLTGVHIPVLPEIYNPILIELENLGIEMVEEYGLPLSEGRIGL